MSELNGEEISKRRMPENIARCMIKLQGKMYLPVAFRLLWFRDECPDWGIFTDIVEGGEAAGYVVFKATITDSSGKIIATAHKTESRKDFPAGFCEKAETGSLGRALAMCGFGTQFTSDMDEGERVVDSPLPAHRTSQVGNQMANNGDVWAGPAKLCPQCNAPIGARHNMKVVH